MIRRDLETRLADLARGFPVVTVTGPRQSGKTTLVRSVFPSQTYVSLEAQDVQRHAQSDPRGFLAEYPAGAIFDEVQRAPELPSYLQTLVDEDPRPGRFILTGSQHFGLISSISQSLAGRTAVVHLFPPTFTELQRFPNPPTDLFEVLFAGAYPRIHDRGLAPADWLAAYVATYIERDVRQLMNVGDLAAFQTFLGICAGRASQLRNLSSLGADSGIDQKTARAWLSVLEASFLVFPLRPFFHNLGKRWTKSPKTYFFDSGLLCHLLGIREPAQIRTHPLRGAIFESWVVAEVTKCLAHAGRTSDLFYWRDHKGFEIDLIRLEGASAWIAEIKSGQTVAEDPLLALERFAEMIEHKDALIRETRPVLVYGGSESSVRRGTRILPWSSVAELALS